MGLPPTGFVNVYSHLPTCWEPSSPPVPANNLEKPLRYANHGREKGWASPHRGDRGFRLIFTSNRRRQTFEHGMGDLAQDEDLVLSLATPFLCFSYKKKNTSLGLWRLSADLGPEVINRYRCWSIQGNLRTPWASSSWGLKSVVCGRQETGPWRRGSCRSRRSLQGGLGCVCGVSLLGGGQTLPPVRCQQVGENGRRSPVCKLKDRRTDKAG